MDREKLLRMAVDAGVYLVDIGVDLWAGPDDALARFAELVRADDKRDAERYRWLRSCEDEFSQLSILDFRGDLDAEALDEAIDNAMSAIGKQEKV